MVTAIMPTANRHEFAREAIWSFHRQTWPNKELVIVDDGIEALNPEYSQHVRYFRFPPIRLSVGLKRNIACELARGKYIVQWDDDDLYLNDRIEHQMDTLLKNPRAAVTGYRRMIFQTPEGRQWRYNGPPHTAVGVSLLYERAHWEENPFPCVRVAEDTAFSFRAGVLNRLAVEDGDGRIVARIHPGNTTAESRTEEYFRQHPNQWEEL